MDRLVRKLANFMAYLGGGVLLALIGITCVSVIGRTLNTLGHSDFVSAFTPFLAPLLTGFGPILGDFELVEAGVAFSIMAFLPLCQLNRGHATVELVTGLFPQGINRLLALLWETVFAFVLIVIAWRLYVGTTDKMRYGETTFMLQFPVWWGYAACAFAAVIACMVAVYSVYLHIRDVSGSDEYTVSGDVQQ
jgi:TRAP-type C4-dicarboxylate transport system permease small subunit